VKRGEANLMSISRKSYRSAIDLLTAAERLDEVGAIMAAGLQRLRIRQSSALPADFGESSLDCVAPQSGAANILTDGGSN
jgi:hypothetical protein